SEARSRLLRLSTVRSGHPRDARPGRNRRVAIRSPTVATALERGEHGVTSWRVAAAVAAAEPASTGRRRSGGPAHSFGEAATTAPRACQRTGSAPTWKGYAPPAGLVAA